MKSAPRAAAPTALIYVAGIVGGLLSFAIANAWHYLLWSPPDSTAPTGFLVPDALVFLLISVVVGVGCGRAGSIVRPAVSDLFGADRHAARRMPVLYTGVIATMTGLIVHAILLLMLFI